MKKLFYFDPVKSFISLPIVWGTIGTLSSAAIFFAIIIAVNSNLEWNIDYHGVNRIFIIYKLPLTIFALIIPIIALLAANHRSEQAKAQILALNEQNVFENYFMHVDEISKYMGKFQDLNYIDANDDFIRKLHHYLFNDALNGEYSPCKSYIDSDIIIKAEFRTAIQKASNELKINARTLKNKESKWAGDGFKKTQEVKESLELKYSELYPFYNFHTLNADKLKEFYTYMDFARRFLSPAEAPCLDIGFLTDVELFDKYTRNFLDRAKRIYSR